jgi:hypothetical protein
MFMHRVGAVAQPILQGTVGRLTRRFENPAVHVEQPAMTVAVNPFLDDQPVLQRGVAVWTIRLQQADSAALLPESNKVLAKDARPARQVAQFAGEDDRLPEAPQLFAARRVQTDAGQILVYRR